MSRRRSARGGKAASSKGRSVPARPRAQRWLLRYGWIVPVGAVVVGMGVLILTYAFASIPLPQDIEIASSAEVYDRNGDLIGTYTGDVRRFLIDTDELLDKKTFIGQAVIASEDRNFYDHNGVDLRGIVRAGWANLTGGAIQQGGSTITQQYIKVAVLQDPSRTFSRKFKEAILAIKLERKYDKSQILGFYLNTIYLGRGAYGFEAAARTYFGKSADQLNLSEAAYLAGIIPSPESYQLDENRKGAKTRRDRVLDLMVKQGFITRDRAAQARRHKLRLDEIPDGIEAKTQEAAYFMEWLRKDYLYPEYGNDLYTGGLKIHTTLDLEMQQAAEDAVDGVLTLPEDPQAALVSITPSGAVRAMVGGRDHDSLKKAEGFNFAADAPGRSPGSTAKTFTLVSGIEEEDISPQSRFSGSSPKFIDEPACYTDGGPWEVENYGGSSYGTITLDQATTNSVNTVFAQLVGEIGPNTVAQTMLDFGFSSPSLKSESPPCAIALGALDVTVVEAARAYAALAGGGVLPEVQPIRYITNSEDDCIKDYRANRIECDVEEKVRMERIIDENTANVVTQTLTHVVQEGTATAANIGRPVAGKTGTSQENKDAWFAGYVPQLTTVVWMGYPRQESGVVPQMTYCLDPNLCRPVHGSTVTGGQFSAPIWAAYMSAVTADMPVKEFPVPEDLPDEIINSPAPPPPPPTASPSPSPKKDGNGEPSPEPSFEPSPLPSQEPSPEPSSEPSPQPSVLPSPGEEGERRRGRDPG